MFLRNKKPYFFNEGHDQTFLLFLGSVCFKTDNSVSALEYWSYGNAKKDFFVAENSIKNLWLYSVQWNLILTEKLKKNCSILTFVSL